jgi:hypothetical protein
MDAKSLGSHRNPGRRSRATGACPRSLKGGPSVTENRRQKQNGWLRMENRVRRTKVHPQLLTISRNLKRLCQKNLHLLSLDKLLGKSYCPIHGHVHILEENGTYLK